MFLGKLVTMPSLAGLSPSFHPDAQNMRPALGGQLFYHDQASSLNSRHGVGVVTRVWGQRPNSAAIMNQSLSTRPPHETSSGKYLRNQAICCRDDHCLCSGHDLRGSELLL